MPSQSETGAEGLIEDVLTREEQAKLTPRAVIELLKAGNQRFVDGELTVRNHRAQIRQAAKSQYPKAIVLSCVDSRVPVEDVFDRGIGDIFVARVAGNFVNVDILGSMEFACKVAGAKVILVLGHEHCGAIKSAIAKVELGNITAMLEKLKPAVEAVEGYEPHTDANAQYVHAVTEQNVRLSIGRIREESPTLKAMEDGGEIAIVGAVYDMDDGSVHFLA